MQENIKWPDLPFLASLGAICGLVEGTTGPKVVRLTGRGASYANDERPAVTEFLSSNADERPP